MHDQHRGILVIGAGIAGLTAARLLSRAGLDVAILEARDRIGGRLHTERTDGRITDLGASWIHGIENEPLAQVAEAFGMNGHEFTLGSYQVDGRPIAYYSPEGQRMTSDQAREFQSDVNFFDDYLERHLTGSPAGTSYARNIDVMLPKTPLKGERATRVKEYLHHRSEEQEGADAHDLDTQALIGKPIEGDEIVFADGYDRLTDSMSADLEIHLQHRVTEIEWHEQRVTVRGTSSSNEPFAMSAQKVIATLPIGVLRHGDVSFLPELPEHVSKALSGIRANSFEKIFLRFSERFWDRDVYAIRRLGPAGKWWHSWYDLSDLHGEPTLLTFAAGDCARSISSWSDAEISSSIMHSLRDIYGDRTLDPVQVTVTRWGDEEFTRGAYSYLSTGTHPSQHNVLGSPMAEGALQLAGEATWSDDPATVPGAFASGWRAAEVAAGREFELADLLDTH